MTSASRQLGGRGSRAFTLIELLVVIAIITLLIGILLPALSRARELGRIAVCGNNMRSMAQAHIAYTNEYKGELAGSPATSGLHAVETGDIPVQYRARSRRLQNISSAGGVQATFNGVAVQNWDHYGPLAAFSGKQGPGDDIAAGPLPQSSSGAVEQTRGLRFDWLRRLEEFRCPNNVLDVQVTDPRNLGSGARLAQIGPGPIISYESSTQFVAVPRVNSGAQTGETQFFAGQSSRGVYFPRIDRVGLAANKLMFMEGARFSNTASRAGGDPTINTQLSATAGGSFADNGAWTNIGRMLDRAAAPGEAFRDDHLSNPRQFPITARSRSGTTFAAGAGPSARWTATWSSSTATSSFAATAWPVSPTSGSLLTARSPRPRPTRSGTPRDWSSPIRAPTPRRSARTWFPDRLRFPSTNNAHANATDRPLLGRFFYLGVRRGHALTLS
ncbi:MAG: hypothetical protein C0513_05395 [Isosphaera sp.]|nr:hypothetical protein [Isosphaera sp.]